MHKGPDETMTATVELPGLKREDVSVELHDGRLTVSGEYSASFETKKPEETVANGAQVGEGEKHEETNSTLTSPSFIVRERSYGKFSRTLPVPKGIKPESIKASMADGLLTITFPKNVSEAEPKKIQVA